MNFQIVSDVCLLTNKELRRELRRAQRAINYAALTFRSANVASRYYGDLHHEMNDRVASR